MFWYKYYKINTSPKNALIDWCNSILLNKIVWCRVDEAKCVVVLVNEIAGLEKCLFAFNILI